jgi:hypothetical protein
MVPDIFVLISTQGKRSWNMWESRFPEIFAQKFSISVFFLSGKKG